MKLQKNHNNTKMALTRQSGFSLVELLIASTLGLFIVGGVITSFMGTKESEKMRSTISEMDANARTAIDILRRNIALAGYSSMRNNQGFDKPFYSEQDELELETSSLNRTCGNGMTMNSSNDITPGAPQYTRDRSRGDVLTSVYLADNPCRAGKGNCPNIVDMNPKAMVYTDCTGGGATRDARTVGCSTDKDVGMGQDDPLQAKIYNTFYLGSGTEAQRHTLMCQGNRGGAQPLVENIEYLQFLYGVTSANGNTVFLRAGQVETNAEWEYVTSVRVGLLMRSSRNVLSKAATKDKYILFDRNVKVDDLRRLFRVYTTTINLPNRNRGQIL